MQSQRLRAVALLAVLVAAIGGGTAGCALGCNTALATGVVAASGSDLVLTDETGVAHPVAWPDGYGVRRDGDALVLIDRFGTVRARLGDRVEMGGGVGTDDRFHGCGDVVVRAAPSPSSG